jgi:hypothetical protein
MTTNHKFKQMSYTKLCGLCFKPKLDEMHLDHLDESDLIASNLPKLPSIDSEIELVESVESIPTSWVPENSGDPRQMPFVTNIPVSNHIKPKSEQQDSNHPNCYGHKCPECGRHWMHNYKCWPDLKVKEVMHCPEHFAQAISDIHRNDDIANLIKPTLNTAKYLAEQRIEHTSFVVLEAKESGNYEQWIQNHIQNLRSLIEQYNNKIFASTTALADLRKEDGNKLTPEEIEQYKRAAAKQKKIKENTNKEESKKEWTKMLKNLASMVGNEDIAKAQLKEIYKTQGKEIPE